MASVCTVKTGERAARAARAARGDERCLLSDLSELHKHRPFARRANPVNGQVLILPQPPFLFYNNSGKIIPARVIFKDETLLHGLWRAVSFPSFRYIFVLCILFNVFRSRKPQDVTTRRPNKIM